MSALTPCFRTSAAIAADPLATPASVKVVRLSGEVTVRSKADGLLNPVLYMNISWTTVSFCLLLCHNLLQAVPPDMLDGRTVKRPPSSCCGIALHPLHLYMSLHGVLGGLAGVQDSMDCKNLKMCPFQATTSMQSGTHQDQGEG